MKKMILVFIISLFSTFALTEETSVYKVTADVATMDTTPLTMDKSAIQSQNIMQLILGLIIVVGLIFACAWVMRRIGGTSGLTNQHIKSIACLPLGNKEKLVIVQAGNKQLLLGVTANQISCLSELDQPIEPVTPDSQFADRIKRLLKGQLSEIPQK